MVLPTIAVALDKAHSSLAETPRHQARPSEILSHLIIQTAQLLRRLALLADVLQPGLLGQHAESELERGNAAIEGAIQSDPVLVAPGDPHHHVELEVLQLGSAAVASEGEGGVTGLGMPETETRALVLGRQEGRPKLFAPRSNRAWQFVMYPDTDLFSESRP